MNKLESSKLNYFLHKLSDPSLSISVHNDNLILSNCKFDDAFEERIRNVVDYISSHLSNELKSIGKKIQNKFTLEAGGKDHKTQKAVRPYLDKLEALINSLPEPTNGSKPPSFPSLLQVAAIPKNKAEFISNLRLILQNFPRYQLHQDLSVFDVTFQSMPPDWNFELLMDALEAEFIKYEGFRPAESSHITAIKQEIFELLKFPVAMKLGTIIETSTTGKEAALYDDFCRMAEKKIPFLVNRYFFQVHSNKLINLSDLDIYLQKGGEFCVVVPKGKSLTEFGFNKEELEISKGEHFLPSGYPLQLPLAIQQLLINEQGHHRIFRLVNFFGHGYYPGYPGGLDLTQEGMACGLSTNEFNKSLAAYKAKNTIFMAATGCYIGGTISADIHLSDHTLPFPIYLASSFDTVTSISGDDEFDITPILDESQKLLFLPMIGGQPFMTKPRQLTKVRQKLSQILNNSNPADMFSNLGTLLLPTDENDIPKVAYTLCNPEQIFDVSHIYRKKESHVLLEDDIIDRKAYLFSDPIAPFILKVSATLPMILLSRGGSAHHLLKEVVAPQQNIEDIAKETFNSFNTLGEDIHHKEPAYKVFFISHFKCKFEGKEANLTQVMIRNSFRKRDILFKLKGEDGFRRITFTCDKNCKGYQWKKENSEKVNLNEALSDIYQAMADSTPSSKTLLQNTAGRQCEEDFMEAFDRIFFAEQIPEAAKINNAILKDRRSGPNNTSALKKALIEFKQRLGNAPREQLVTVLKQAYDLAAHLNMPETIEELKLSSYTPLMLAVKSGDLKSVKEILASHPESLETETITGSTALFLAVYFKKFEIGKWLIEKGASLNHINQHGYTAFSIACTQAEPEFIEWILKTVDNYEGDEGVRALIAVLEYHNFKMANFLIDHQVGAKANPISLLQAAISFNSGIEIIEKMVRFFCVDINQDTNSSQDSLLDVCVHSQDPKIVKFFLDRGADPNKKNIDLISPLHIVPFANMLGIIKFDTSDNLIEMAKLLLEAGADINCSADGDTPLHYAVLARCKPLIEFLIRRGASLTIEGKTKKNPLELAGKDPDLLEFILQIPGIDINPKLGKLYKLVEEVLINENVKLAKLLVMHGVNINESLGGGETFLMRYLRQVPPQKDLKPVMQFFIENGADLAQVNNEGNSAMHMAMEKQDISLFKCLKDANVSYDKPANKLGKTPLMVVLSKTPNPSFFQEILSPKGGSPLYQAMIEARSGQVDKLNAEFERLKKLPGGKPEDFHGLPFLQAAFYLGLDSDDNTRGIIIKFIEQFPNIINEKYHKFPIEVSQDLDVVKKLIKHGAEINSKTTFEICDLELIKLLDDKGFDLSGRTGLNLLKLLVSKTYTRADQKEGIEVLLSKIKQSPHGALSQAIQEKAKGEIIDSLISHPALDLQKASKKWGSPLAGAIFVQNVPILRKLISMNALYKVAIETEKNGLSNPFVALTLRKETDELLETAECLMTTTLKSHLNGLSVSECKCIPLVNAILSKYERLATLMINHGADVNYANTDGNTPLHFLLRAGMNDNQKLSLAKLLISKGAKWDIPNKDGFTAKDLAIKWRLGKVLQLMQ